MKTRCLLNTQQLDIHNDGGRVLIQGLHLSMANEKVAVIGRNGVGKSHLLQVLAQQRAPQRGQVQCLGSLILLEQLLPPTSLSPGEARRQRLQQAFSARPDILLLDEPSQDLDGDNLRWLQQQLRHWRGGLLLVSHDSRLLTLFEQFLLVTEQGCQVMTGSFAALQQQLQQHEQQQQLHYLRHSQQLIQQEKQHETILQRRQQKKMQGRWREAGRMTSRMRLNSKRSYAQVSQGKVALVREQRIQQCRATMLALRQNLPVKLALQLRTPQLAAPSAEPIISLHEVAITGLFGPLNLQLYRQKLTITGPNGSGKTSLLQILLGQYHGVYHGSLHCQRDKIGYIAQNASNWQLNDSLLDVLYQRSTLSDATTMVQQLLSHHFPLALAQRPLHTLSPGERLRAALICLFNQAKVECLILDEPSEGLDLFARNSLIHTLKNWPGSLLLVSHDGDMLAQLGVERWVEM